MYAVMYRSENPDSLRERYGLGKYITVFASKTSKYKKVCFRFAVRMNNHIKKFHKEEFGKRVYFVTELKELKQ